MISEVRNNRPNVLVLKSTRLGPHSKGDDTRTQKELSKLYRLDPIKKLEKKLKKISINDIQKKCQLKIDKIFNEVLKEHKLNLIQNHNTNFPEQEDKTKYLDDVNLFKDFKGKRFGEKINFFFKNILKKDKKIFFLGEDIDDPYGGAFKISKGLKTNYKNQVFSTPISEASIVGLASGMSMKGYKPIVEIMFGDFLTLTFDQVVNNLSKFHEMYNKGITNPVLIRTPMGGRRGYGPTHSQSLEKFFLGVHGLNVYALNTIFPMQNIYKDALIHFGPSLIIENKTQYNFVLEDLNNQKFSQFKIQSDVKKFLTKLSLTDFRDDRAAVICYGGLTELILDYVFSYYIETEISLKIIVLSKISPLNYNDIKEDIKKNDTIFIVEESDGKYGFSSEIISKLSEDKECANKKFKRITSNEGVIPASIDQENKFLVNKEKFFDIVSKSLNND